MVIGKKLVFSSYLVICAQIRYVSCGVSKVIVGSGGPASERTATGPSFGKFGYGWFGGVGFSRGRPPRFLTDRISKCASPYF